jgi:hypothetical protein
LEVVRRNGTQK